MKRIPVLIMSIALALALAACAPGETGPQSSFGTDLTAGAEIPTPVLNGATPIGVGTATLNDTEDTLVVEGTFEGLTGPATGAHIHGPATEDDTAGVIFPLNVDSAVDGEFSGTWDTITAEQIEQLRDGMFYINVHTQQNPQGEIRGQLE